MDDKGIVRLYWDQNELAIRETSAKYGGYIKTLPAYSQYSLQSFSNMSKSFVLLASGVETPLCFL